MKLYFIARGEEPWEGGLIIAAENKERAAAIYRAREGLAETDPVFNPKELATDKEGVVYDDYLR